MEASSNLANNRIYFWLKGKRVQLLIKSFSYCSIYYLFYGMICEYMNEGQDC
jgi:hypothetical protein